MFFDVFLLIVILEVSSEAEFAPEYDLECLELFMIGYRGRGNCKGKE